MTQQDSADSGSSTHFFNSMDLPTIGTEHISKVMTGEITKQELDNAISRLKTDQMPSADGYSAECYTSIIEMV